MKLLANLPGVPPENLLEMADDIYRIGTGNMGAARALMRSIRDNVAELSRQRLGSNIAAPVEHVRLNFVPWLITSLVEHLRTNHAPAEISKAIQHGLADYDPLLIASAIERLRAFHAPVEIITAMENHLKSLAPVEIQLANQAPIDIVERTRNRIKDHQLAETTALIERLRKQYSSAEIIERFQKSFEIHDPLVIAASLNSLRQRAIHEPREFIMAMENHLANLSPAERLRANQAQARMVPLAAKHPTAETPKQSLSEAANHSTDILKIWPWIWQQNIL